MKGPQWYKKSVVVIAYPLRSFSSFSLSLSCMNPALDSTLSFSLANSLQIWKKWEVKFRLLAFYISFFSLKELKFDINIHKSYSFAGLQSTKIMPLRNQKRSEKTKEELFLLLQSWFYDWKEFMKLFALLHWVTEKMTWVKFTWIISQVHLSRVKPSWMISQVDLSRVKPTWKAYLNYRSSQLETSRLYSS